MAIPSRSFPDSRTSPPETQATLEASAIQVDADGLYTVASVTYEGADKALVLHAVGAEPSADPVDGTSYAVGDSIGNAVVIEVSTDTKVYLQGGSNYFKALIINTGFSKSCSRRETGAAAGRPGQLSSTGNNFAESYPRRAGRRAMNSPRPPHGGR